MIAMDTNENIYTWGMSKCGALGMGSNPFSALPIKVSIAQRASNIDRIYCGPDCSLILFKNGEIFACGQNNFNKLAFGRKVESVDMFVSSNKF